MIDPLLADFFTRINLTCGEFEKLVESQWDRKF